MTRIIDAHTHIFPPEVLARRDELVARDFWFGHLYENPKARLVGAEEILASMETAGIDQSVVCGFPWSDPGRCREHNDYLAEACAGSGGRLVWLGIVRPGDGGAAAEAERAFANGALGLGEFNADGQGFDLRSSAGFADLAELCVSMDRPIMIHTSEPVGHTYPGKGLATPEKVVPFLRAFPELRVAAAHWGGGLPFYELVPSLSDLGNRLVYDSAASTYLYRFEVFRTVIDLVGASRVLFASDYPVLRQDRFLARVEQTPWRDEDERAIVLGGAAAAFYRIPEIAE
jgi:predicted TIM-barrel fold metal-dependent hydrolase